MKLNAKCEVCGKGVHRKPYQLANYSHTFCSKTCQYSGTKKAVCPVCHATFPVENKRRVCCSRKCANIHRAGMRYNKQSKSNATNRRLWLLRETFKDLFDSCMIEGCAYNRCYAVHRLNQGRDGGRYEIGNMFALCPNHHAEIHAGIIEVEKISDCVLRITKDGG